MLRSQEVIIEQNWRGLLALVFQHIKEYCSWECNKNLLSLPLSSLISACLSFFLPISSLLSHFLLFLTLSFPLPFLFLQVADCEHKFVHNSKFNVKAARERTTVSSRSFHSFVFLFFCPWCFSGGSSTLSHRKFGTI